MYYLKLYQDRRNAVMVYKCGLLKQIIHLVSWKSWRFLVGDTVLWQVFMEPERYRFFLAAQDVFKQNKSPKHKNKDLLISASYFEIYGSKVSEKISRIFNMLHFKAWEYQVSWLWKIATVRLVISLKMCILLNPPPPPPPPKKNACIHYVKS